MALWYLLALFLYIKASEDTSGRVTAILYQAGAVLCFMLSAGVEGNGHHVSAGLAAVGRCRAPAHRCRACALRSCRTICRSGSSACRRCRGLEAPSLCRSRAIQFRYPSTLGQSFERTPRRHLRAVIVFLSLEAELRPRFSLCCIRYSSGHCLSNPACGLDWPWPPSSSVRRLPLLTFGIGWFVLQMLPTTVIPRNDLLSERNLYLASIGILLVVVVLGSGLTHWLIKVLTATPARPDRRREPRSSRWFWRSAS